jgi:hypothetical protein
LLKGEFSVVWNFSEDEYITPADNGEDDADDKKKDK